MINANQITSRLRMMSDQELQRFAEMHKQDPYMFPLAFNESNMRKEMRSAPQGQGAAPQAPVNQQALAAMQPAQLPEDQGIGALNPNMQFADGGLVSFAGGGESTAGPYSRADDRDFGTGGVAYADGGTIRFAGGEEVPSPRYGRGLIPYAPYRISNYSPEDIAERKAKREQEERDQAAAEEAFAQTPEGRRQAGIRQSVLDPLKAIGRGAADLATFNPRLIGTGLNKIADTARAFGVPAPMIPGLGTTFEAMPLTSAAGKLQDAKAAESTASGMAYGPGRAELTQGDAERLKLLAAAPPAPDMSGAPGTSINKPPLPGNSATRPGADAGGVPMPTMSGGPGAVRAPAAAVAPRAPAAAVAPRAPGGLPPVGEDYRSAPAIEKVFGEYVTDAETEAQKRIEAYQKDRPAPETFAEQKALLEENRADVEKESRMNEGLAWLTFASRVVQPGKNTIQALVEGASAGGEQYARAQKDLKKAEKERKMGLAALAQAERAEKRNDYDKVEMYKQQAMQRADKARDASVLALSHATGKDTEVAAQRMDNALKIASQEKIAAEQNAANLEAARLMGQSRIDVANIGAGGRDERTQQALDARFLADLAKQWNDPGQRFQIGTQYPGVKSWEDFVKVKRFELQKAQSITGGKGGASPMTPTGVREEDD